VQDYRPDYGTSAYSRNESFVQQHVPFSGENGGPISYGQHANQGHYSQPFSSDVLSGAADYYTTSEPNQAKHPAPSTYTRQNTAVSYPRAVPPSRPRNSRPVRSAQASPPASMPSLPSLPVPVTARHLAHRGWRLLTVGRGRACHGSRRVRAGRGYEGDWAPVRGARCVRACGRGGASRGQDLEPEPFYDNVPAWEPEPDDDDDADAEPPRPDMSTAPATPSALRSHCAPTDRREEDLESIRNWQTRKRLWPWSDAAVLRIPIITATPRGWPHPPHASRTCTRTFVCACTRTFVCQASRTCTRTAQRRRAV
jgi:hypothetical protein